MTKKEIDEIERAYQRYSYTQSAQRILRLIAYVRRLESERDKRNDDNGRVEQPKRRRKDNKSSKAVLGRSGGILSWQ